MSWVREVTYGNIISRVMLLPLSKKCFTSFNLALLNLVIFQSTKIALCQKKLLKLVVSIVESTIEVSNFTSFREMNSCTIEVSNFNN